MINGGTEPFFYEWYDGDSTLFENTDTINEVEGLNQRQILLNC